MMEFESLGGHIQMAQDRKINPVELFAGLVGGSLGDLNAEMQELREIRDRIEAPKKALETAAKQIVEREFAQAVDTLKPIVERMPERTDLGTLQRHAQQLLQLQCSFEAVHLDRQVATFESLAEVIELAERVLTELPEKFHTYPLELREKIKARQLLDLDALLSAPSTFTERVAWLHHTWPDDPGVESAVKSKADEAVGAAKGMVEDVKAKRFPGSAIEWHLFVARTKRLSGAIEHLVQGGFVSSDTARLSKDELTKLEGRAEEMGMLDALVCQDGLTEDERLTALQLAAKHGLTHLTTGLSVADELKALSGRIQDRKQKKQVETREKRLKRIANELSRTRAQALKGQIEAALQELEDFAPDDPVRKWLQTALDEAMPGIEASLAEAERLHSELLHPQSLLIPVGDRVKSAQEAYQKASDLLSGLERGWPEAETRLAFQQVEQPPWPEYWADRSRKLQSHLPIEQQPDSLGAVLLIEHFMPLLSECLEYGPDDSLAARLQRAKESLPEAWKAQVVKSGFFDVQAASRRIAQALLNHSEEQKDVLARAWLAMLGVAATPGTEYESAVAKKALDTIGRERIDGAVEMILGDSQRNLEQKMDAGNADLQRQINELRGVSRQESDAYLTAISQLLWAELSKTTNDVKLRWPLLVALRHVPAGMTLDDTDLIERIRQTILDIGRKYALEEGPESVLAELMYLESQILLENMSRKKGGLQ